MAKYETPAHHDIHKLGIMPDRVVAQEPITYEQIGTEKDSQYQTAIQFLNQKTILAKASWVGFTAIANKTAPPDQHFPQEI